MADTPPRCQTCYRVTVLIVKIAVVLAVVLTIGVNVRLVYRSRTEADRTIVLGQNGTIWNSLSSWKNNLWKNERSDAAHDRPTKVTSAMQPCPPLDNDKAAKMVKVIESGDLSIPTLEAKFSSVQVGGRWRPTSCKAVQRVAIIVPYRERERELQVFLNHMHPFLQRQNLDYTVFIIEQTGGVPFNRGMLFNVGFLEIVKREYYDCYLLHDLDVLPEDDRIGYTCTDHPRHLAAACSKWGYRLAYATIFGGVTAFSPRQFLRVNGYSNGYFGWGAEDDDLYHRVVNRGYKVLRYPIAISRYKTLSHKGQPANNRRFFYLNRWKERVDRDGLNSALYTMKSFSEKKLYTHMLMHLDPKIVLGFVDGLMDRGRAQSLTTYSILMVTPGPTDPTPPKNMTAVKS